MRRYIYVLVERVDYDDRHGTILGVKTSEKMARELYLTLLENDSYSFQGWVDLERWEPVSGDNEIIYTWG